jgi:protease II
MTNVPRATLAPRPPQAPTLERGGPAVDVVGKPGKVSWGDDGNLLAYTTDNTGYRQYALHVKDLRTGQTLPDTTERVTSVEWAADNKTLFLTTEDAVTKRSDKLWRHVLGTAAFDPIYEEKDELYDIRLDKTRDKKHDKKADRDDDPDDRTWFADRSQKHPPRHEFGREARSLPHGRNGRK